MLKRFAALCCAVYFAIGPASAQEPTVPDKLTLAQALAIAFERNPALAAVQREIDIAQAAKLDVSRRPNPAVSFESEGYPLFESPRPAFGNNQELTLRFDQEIELAGRRRLRTEAAAAGVLAAEEAFLDARRRLEFEVRRAYFGVVLANADLEVARTALDEIDRVIGLNRARFQQGEISGGELRRIQVERLKFVDDLFAAELALRNARSSLLALFNATDLGAQFEVAERLNVNEAGTVAAPTAQAPQPLDAGTLRTQALATRPDLAAAQRDVQRADTETRLQRALRTPNVTVGGGYKRDFGSDAVVFGVTVPLPLFNRNAGGVARAEAERQRAANRAAATATGVLLDVQQAINTVEVSRARVSYIEREYLNPSRESRDIVLASYRLGTADLIDFLDAQRAFRDTLRTYNRALYEERISTFQLTAAIGASSSQP